MVPPEGRGKLGCASSSEAGGQPRCARAALPCAWSAEEGMMGGPAGRRPQCPRRRPEARGRGGKHREEERARERAGVRALCVWGTSLVCATVRASYVPCVDLNPLFLGSVVFSVFAMCGFGVGEWEGLPTPVAAPFAPGPRTLLRPTQHCETPRGWCTLGG